MKTIQPPKQTAVMWRSLLTVLITTGLFFIFRGTGLADVTISESFDSMSLGFSQTEDVYDYYDLLGTPQSAYSGTVIVRNELVGRRPSIEEVGPIGQRSWVFSAGSSIKWRDVHWRHHVDIRYDVDRLMSSATVSFKYLNTRACGGRVRVVFAQYAEDGSVVWSAKRGMENWENWPGPYVSRIPGTIDDRSWRSYTLTPEQVDLVTQGRPFNSVTIRETDITSERGSGYFDDIEIHLKESFAEEEVPAEEEPPMEEEAAEETICEPIIIQVPVEVEVIKEVPVEVEKIVYVDKIIEKEVVVEVPVEIIVEKIVEVPVERVVVRRVKIPVEKIVYLDKVIEAPEKCSHGDQKTTDSEYKKLLAEYNELKKQIERLSVGNQDEKENKPKEGQKEKDDNGHGNDPGHYDYSNPGKKFKK